MSAKLGKTLMDSNWFQKHDQKSKRGISINKEKDVNDLLRMYDKIASSVNTPIMPPNMLGPYLNNKAVNESQYKGTKPRAKPGHKKHSTSKQPLVSSNDVTKGGSSKAPTSSKIGPLKRKKESNSAMDSNPSHTLASTPVVVEMHKEDLQATGGPTSLGVTSKVRVNPQLSSGMSEFNLNEPIYSTSFIIHFEFASRNDASTISTAGVYLGISAPSTDPHVLIDKTKSVSDWLETVLTTSDTGTSNAAKTSEEIKFGAIKIEDLTKLVPIVKVDFKDLDSPEDDPITVVDDSEEDKEDKNAEIHSTTNDETEDILASTPPSPRSIQLQELKNQVLLLQSQKHTLEIEKRKAEAEITRLKAQPFFPNVGQLNEHLVKSLTTEFLKILSAHDFSSLLPTELKGLPSKFDELTEEVKGLKKQVHEFEIELPGDLKEISSKLEEFTKTITSLTSQVAELKTLQWELSEEFVSLHVQVASVQTKLQTVDALPGLLLKLELKVFLQQAKLTLCLLREEKNKNQATISQLFQRQAEKNTEKENLNNQQPKPTTPPPIPPIIKTTTHMQSSFLSKSPESSSQPEGEQTKIDKGKKDMCSKDAEEECTESDFDDETTHVPGSTVESSKKKELKRFDFVTEYGEHVHLTKEQISTQKKIEEEAKVEAAKREGQIRKEYLIDLLGPEVVNNYDILTIKGLITLKVYTEDDTSKIIPEFNASDLHLGEWIEVVTACPNKKGKGWTSIYKQIQERMDYLRTTEAELGIDLDKPLSDQDPFDRLNDLANKKRKHDDDIHDFFRANKRLKLFNIKIIQLDFVTIEDFRDFSNTMLYIVQEIFFRLHQGPGLDDHARTFSSLLLAEIDKRNLNPLKQMRVIEQLRK
ncbi:hypothetical protein Tco_0899690 [Tanacetum coccineum]